MNGKGIRSTKARRNRTIKVTPVTRAVRLALAASVTALALGMGGNAFAADCAQVQKQQIGILRCDNASIDTAPVFDLTMVPNALIGAQSPVNSLIGDGTTPTPPVGLYYSQADSWQITSSSGSYAFSDIGDVHTVHLASTAGSVVVVNNADLSATSTGGEAVALYTAAATTNYVNNNAVALTADGYTDAAGLVVFGGDDVTVVNSGVITANALYGNAYGILASSSGGDVAVTNNLGGDITADSVYGNAYGIFAVADEGTVDVDNAADIQAHSFYGNAIGIFGYSASGDVTIDNDGSVYASAYWIADGIFASGANVEVNNNAGASIYAYGYNWAAGIEAQGTASATATNSGAITASVDGWGYDIYGNPYAAYGIFASAADGDASVTNTDTGSITARGYYATGISVQAYGDAGATNAGSIDAGTTTGSALAWGIRALSTGEGAAVTIDNSGDITAAAIYGATGIEAVASGYGGTASVTNTGDIIVTQNRAMTSYGGYGVLASADGDSTIYNDGGYVDVTSRGPAFGLVSNSFAGTASVTNTGDVYATSTLNSSGNPSVGATGIVAFSGNGTASVDNSGYVNAHGVRSGTGIYAGAGADGDVTVTNSGEIVATTNLATSARANGIKVAAGGGDIEVVNSGSIFASGAVLAFGVYSSNGTGDTHISNAEYGDIEFYSYGGRGFGAFAFAEQGDASVENAGYIHGYAWQQAYGARIRDLYGDASASNSGSIDVESGNNKAFGLLAVSQYAGTASISNSGDISAVAHTAAYGVRAYGADGANVGNSGSIYANGDTVAVGMMADSGGDTTVTNTDGSIVAIGGNVAIGILAYADGNVSVTNASEITAIGYNSFAAGINVKIAGDVNIGNSGDISAGSFGDAIGIYGYSADGNTTIGNTADVSAVSIYGLADGIFASGQDVTVTNSGYSTATTYFGPWAAGIEAEGTTSATVTNSGVVAAQESAWGLDAYGNPYAAYGIHASAAAGDVSVTNTDTGLIAARGYYATGIHTQSYGDTSIDNAGTIYAGDTADSALGWGIRALATGEGAAVSINNSGYVYGAGYFGGTGIEAIANGLGGTASVVNSGYVYAVQDQMYGYGAYGILASADGAGSIDNSGTVGAYSGGVANGLTALSFAGDASVTNSGDVNAVSSALLYYAASGIVAFAGNGETFVDNSGNVSAISGYIANAVDAQGQQGVTVTNSGSLYANGMARAYGVLALSSAGDVSVSNAEGGDIGFYSYYGAGFGVLGIAYTGDVTVDNAGAISGYAYGQSVGVFALAYTGDASVTSGGSISAITGGSAAVGIFARADYGTASVDNSGDIYASVDGVNGYTGDVAYGVLARGGYADVANSGNIEALGFFYATGIAASSYYGTTVHNTGGSISAVALGGATGIDAQSLYGDVTVTNASDIEAVGIVYGGTGIAAVSGYGNVVVGNSGDIYAASAYGDAIGIHASSPYDIAVTNSGDITANTSYGYAIGIRAAASYTMATDEYGYTYGVSHDGTTTVANSGDIVLQAPYASFGKAFGIVADRWYGDVAITNSGNIDITSGGRAYGISANSKYGDVTIHNSGDITMYSATDAQIGIDGSTGKMAGGGDVNIINSGDIAVHAFGFANGIGGHAGQFYTPYGDIYVGNTGNLDIYGQSSAAGIEIRATDGNAKVVNTGDVNVETVGLYSAYSAPYDSAVGIGAITWLGGDATIQNGGDVNVHGYSYSYGLYAKSRNDGTVTVTNAGDVTVQSDAYVARGVYAYNYAGDITVNNSASGSIDAVGGGIAAVGVHTIGLYGDQVINNSGSIHAGNSPYAYAVFMQNYFGTSTLNNARGGVISADGPDGSTFAVVGSYAVDTINNAGTITGAVVTSYGDDVFNNTAGGVWDVNGTWSSDFGEGDDIVKNAAGGTILLDSAGIYLGGSIDGNAFNNAGTIKVNGDSLIDMGGGYSGEGGLDFAPTGFGITPQVAVTPSLVPSLNPLPLVNTGAIDMGDGAADDSLTIIGDLGGNGALNIDVDVPSNTADHLIVDGSMVPGAVQTVNAAFNPSLLAAVESGQMTQFAWVTGNSTAGSFVGGQVLGFDASNFLSLGVVVTSSISADNSTDDVFSIGIGANGLNDAGTLAANAASGAAGMLNAQIGTFRQRMGVNPYGDAGKVMSAFFRTYTSEGDVNPTHAADVGNAGHFAYDQSVWGREVGVNANLFGNFHAGLVLGSADGRQRLTGDGMGTSRMDGTTFGAYATWFAPQGFYVDVSGRWMAVDIVSTSAGGQQASRAHTGAWNLEAGYDWKVGGLSIVPQLQYTRTKVDGISAVHGDVTTFQGHGGVSERGRLGVEVSKQFQTTNGVRWTPYGSINAVREFDGEMTYTVADVFTGSTSTKSTSTMAELGLGVQKGNWGVTVGAHWTDGGAFKSTVGGQAIVRFAW